VCLAYPLIYDNQTKRDRIACMNTTESYSTLLQFADVLANRATAGREPLPTSNLAVSLAPNWPDEDVDDNRPLATTR
jgi:hypothetical protein